MGKNRCFLLVLCCYKILISKDTYDWKIPTAYLMGDLMVGLIPKNDYKIKVNLFTGVDKNCSQWGYVPEKGCKDSSAKLIASDESDNSFTINSSIITNLRKEGETCGENIGNCETGLKCGYPCGIQGCQFVCMQKDTPLVP